MDESKRIILMKTFILSYFNYCPLIWMFCSRKGNSRINRIHERAMRIGHYDYESTFEQLLIKNKTITSYKKHLQYLAIEIYKTFNGLNPPFIDEIFSINECPYYFRNSKFKTAEPHCKIYGFNTVSYICSQIWNSVPYEINYSPSLQICKKKISEFTSFNCTCNLCKEYVSNIGYI